MPIELLFTWMMVFLRALGLILMFPTLGNRPLPPMVRVGIAALLATLMYGLVPTAVALPSGNGQLIITSLGEVVLGLAFGFVGRLIFAAVDMAGRMITQEIGLMGAPGTDAPAPSSEPLAAFMSAFAGLMFFLLGGHIGALSAFYRSFEFAAAGAPAFSSMSIEHLIKATGDVIELGFRIAAPFMALNFIINLAFSILGRAIPRLNVFFVSYPVKSILGLILLAGSGALVSRYLAPELSEMPFRMLEMVAG